LPFIRGEEFNEIEKENRNYHCKDKNILFEALKEKFLSRVHKKDDGEADG